MNNTKNTLYIITTVGIYLLLTVVFFLQRGGAYIAPIRDFVAVPTLFAAIATAVKFRNGGRMIPLALFASAAGDWAGAEGNFIMQVAFFAVAHLFYISDFSPRIKRFERGKVACATLFTIGMLCFLGYVMTHIESNMEFYAVWIYGIIIASMGVTAFLQARARRALYVIAAVLFILSDSLIAYGRFVEPIPDGNTWVMTTYYAAQGLFMYLMLRRSSAAE